MDEGKNNVTKENRDTSVSGLMDTRESSMTSLILWNISKAEENNPSIDLRIAINNIQEQLNGDSCDFNKIISLHAEERHLACALLAWQELGHATVDSLYEFVATRTRGESNELSCNLTLDRSTRDPKCIRDKTCKEFVDNSECMHKSGKKATYCDGKTPSKKRVNDFEDSTSSYSKVEEEKEKFKHIYDSGRDLNDNTDKITRIHFKNSVCQNDYIMTPRNEDIVDIKYSTPSNYKTIAENSNYCKKATYHHNKTPTKPDITDFDTSSYCKTEGEKENSKHTYVRCNHFKDKSDKISHRNVKKPIFRYDDIMTPRNQEVADIKDDSSTYYKYDVHPNQNFIRGKDNQGNSDKTTRNYIKKPTCHHDCNTSLRNQVVRDNIVRKSGKFDTCLLNAAMFNLPVDTKIIMRSENVQKVCQNKQKTKPENKNDIGSKIDAACCMEFACTERLTELDKTIVDLRTRTNQLARRGAERVELLERAEAAWKDLELGYQRRLRMAQEKEEDMAKQIQKLIGDRNSYKEACMNLTTALKQKGETAEKDRAKLIEIEKEICDCANMRLRLSQEFTRGDAVLADHHIKAAQLDRDLQFKEDEAQRKLSSIEGEVELARALTIEAERAMRSELRSLKEQILQLSEQLLKEDSENRKIKTELQDLNQEKTGIIEAVESCQQMCDNHIQDKFDELKKKRDQLSQLKTKVMECKCKLPVDEAVEVKRTPSLAILCKCSSENNILDKCSCTSLRSQLLTNLFADLFDGLQADLDESGTTMSCQLLKCLENKHNWDRSSSVKTSLQSFFFQLILRELDIAIATSIEKHYAKWVDATSVDATKSMERCENCTTDKQEGIMECQTRELAIKLAEQLFDEKTDQLIQRVTDVIKTAAPRCDCKQHTAAVYPCLVKQPTISGRNPASTSAQTAHHSYWKKTSHDVTQIKAQIDDLKKDTIKKEDLMMMENKITKLFQLSLVPEPTSTTMPNIEKQTNSVDVDSKQKENRNHRHLYTEPTKQLLNPKLGSIKKNLDIPSKKKTKNPLNVTSLVDKSNKLYKKLGNTYAVNMCLCGAQNGSKKSGNLEKTLDAPLPDHEYRTSWKQKSLKGFVPQRYESVNETKPASIQILSMPSTNGRENEIPISCRSNVTCFHKIPSNSSIDKLLIYLAKWKDDSKNIGSEKNLSNFLKNSLINGLTNSNSNINSKFNSGNSSYQNPSIDPAIEKTLPTTISEYIGDINLDNVKSDEFFCNSSKEMVANSKNENQEDFNSCLESSDNNSKKSLKNKVTKLNCNSSCKNHSILSKNNLSINPLLLQQHNSEKTSNLIFKNHKSRSLHSSAEDDIAKSKEKINNAEIFHSDCDYYVKFLGVTLTNTNSCKVLGKNKDDYHTTKFKYGTKNVGADILKNDKEPVIKQKVNYEHKKDSIHAPILSKTGITTCQCEAKLDELKQILGETYRRRHELYENEDKALDVQNLKNSLEDTQENCVCCNDLDGIDQSKELEVNTFNLLEDHLKGRLEKFKSYYCKSSCISRDEEENMFSSLLQKVKQVISESANQTRHSRLGQEQTENSWNRVRSLLQEYLNTKIKRIQRLCMVTEEKKQEFILPNVLDKVYNLIEDDFERLKLICKCRSIDASVTLNKREEDYIPEKDNDIIDDNSEDTSKKIFAINETIQDETNNVERLCKLSSNKSMILSHNISAQVSYNLGMETKSCDAMEKGNKIIQTIESIKTICNKNNCYFKPGCDCNRNLSVMTDKISGRCTNKLKFNDVPKYLPDSRKVCYPVVYGVKCNNPPGLHELGFIDSNERIKTSQETPVNNKPDANPVCSKLMSSPYIGYTLDCSCNGQGINTCIKSTIMQNNKRINNILNDTKKKLQSQNISYIMNSVLKTGTTKHITNDNWIISGIDNDIPSAKNVRNSEVGVHNEEEIFLKYSNFNLNVCYNTTNTSDQRISIDNEVLSPVVKNSTSDYKQNILKQIKKQDTYKKHHSILKETNVKSEPLLKSKVKFSELDNLDCDCSLVPVCHVKMFVENIEKKLMHSKCTCDALNPKVCPLHSTKHLI